MKNQVLSREQCNELLALGIDMSNASCMWVSDVDKDYNPATWKVMARQDGTTIEEYRAKFPMSFKEGNVFYTYTLQNILEMLPNTIEWKGKTYWFAVFINALGNKTIAYRDSESWALQFSSFSINGAFKMLKWCKVNGLIKG